MLSRLVFLLALMQAQLVMANGVVQVPKDTVVKRLELKNEDGRWSRIEAPVVEDKKFTLPDGEYKYLVALRGASGVFEGRIFVSDGSNHYIHRSVAPDRQKMFSWASTSVPRSDEYKIESKEAYCLSLQGYGDKPQYMFDACSELAKLDNGKGLFGRGYMYEKGLGGVHTDEKKASECYLRSYQTGFQQAGSAYVLLNQNDSRSTEIVLELAEEGDLWGVGAAAQILARSPEPSERQQAKEYAERSIGLSNPIGFKVLAQLAFQDAQGGEEGLLNSAAWFNLYMLHIAGSAYSEKRFKELLEELLIDEHHSIVRQKTVAYARALVNSEKYLLIDTAVLSRIKTEGNLSLMVGKHFSIPLSGFDNVYSLELLPSANYYSVTLNADDAYIDSTTFQVGVTEDNVYCLTVHSKTKALQMTTRSQDRSCPENANGATSMWNVLNQYQMGH